MKKMIKNVVISMILLIGIMMLAGCGKTVELPYQVDGENIIINSLFQSSINNPDCELKEGENIGSIELQNNSRKFLKELEITIETTDGNEYHFVVEKIPAKSTVLAFDTENKELAENPEIRSITCSKPEYAKKPELMKSKIKVKASRDDSIVMTVKNKKGKTLKNLNLDFHCSYEDVIYGGKAYRYQVKSLKGHKSAEITVVEAYLGDAVFVNAEAAEK